MTKLQIKWVTAAMLLSNIIAGMDSTIITTALPAIVSDLHGIQYMGWIVAIFLLGMAVCSPLWSKLGQRTSNKFAFQAALLVFIVSSAIEGMAPNIWYFLIARFFMGIGAGGMGSLPYIIIGEIFPKYYQRSRALGLISASWGSATIIGPLIGGWIVDAFSWHWVFYFNLPLGIFTIAVVQHFYKANPAQKVPAFDLAGSAALLVGLSCFLLGIQLIGMASPAVCAVLIIAGLIGLFIMSRIERKAVDPIIPGRIFKNRPLLADFLLFSFAWGGGISMANYAPTWAQGLLATSALVGGMTTIPSALTDLTGAQTVPYLQVRFRPATIVFWGLFFILIGTSIMTIAGLHAAFWVLLVAAFFYGCGTGLIFVMLQVKVQRDASDRDMAVATSVSYLVRILAQTLMSAIYGVIMNLTMAHGIRQSGGKITMKMMNKVSDAESVHELPQKYLPLMRQILHASLHNIYLVASIFLAAGILYNWWSAKNYGHNTVMKRESGD